ncbi:MAG: LLM class flavin-dependent oxidoreductase [Chloroflexi bacterium]|nr:LLM class flavin-dependent oxidoreductase [Chloroflexota bacterium]
MKFGLFYEICVPKPWTANKEAQIIRDVIEQVKLAEDSGFDYVWFTEHHFLQEFSHCSAPEVLLGALSQATSRIHLGHGVVLTPPKYNHPARIAERIGMLDILSNGRVELGTGRSITPTELEGFDIDANESRDMWLEGTQLLVKLLTQENVTFEGKYVRMPKPRTVIPRCVQKPHPPLWLAGTSPDSAQRAARNGLGVLFFASGIAPEFLDDKVKIYRNEIKNAQPVGGFVNNQLAGFTSGLCGEDDAETKKTGGAAAFWYNMKGFSVSRWPKGQQPPRTYEYTKDMWTGEEQARAGGYEAMIKSGTIMVGDPESCSRIVKRYAEVGVDQLIIHMQAGAPSNERVKESIRVFGEHVIPRFNKQAVKGKK